VAQAFSLAFSLHLPQNRLLTRGAENIAPGSKL
jgi:hypothetical protein